MPLYEYHCEFCNTDHEAFYKMADKPKTVECPECFGECTQKPCIGLIKGDEAGWLSDTRKVVDPQGGPHCQQFLKDPTRSNYQKWMKGEGLRPMEPGEKSKKPTAEDQRQRRKEIVGGIMEQRRKENTVEVK